MIYKITKVQSIIDLILSLKKSGALISIILVANVGILMGNEIRSINDQDPKDKSFIKKLAKDYYWQGYSPVSSGSIEGGLVKYFNDKNDSSKFTIEGKNKDIENGIKIYLVSNHIQITPTIIPEISSNLTNVLQLHKKGDNSDLYFMSIGNDSLNQVIQKDVSGYNGTLVAPQVNLSNFNQIINQQISDWYLSGEVITAYSNEELSKKLIEWFGAQSDSKIVLKLDGEDNHRISGKGTLELGKPANRGSEVVSDGKISFNIIITYGAGKYLFLINNFNHQAAISAIISGAYKNIKSDDDLSARKVSNTKTFNYGSLRQNDISGVKFNKLHNLEQWNQFKDYTKSQTTIVVEELLKLTK